MYKQSLCADKFINSMYLHYYMIERIKNVCLKFNLLSDLICIFQCESTGEIGLNGLVRLVEIKAL